MQQQQFTTKFANDQQIT